MQLLWSVQPIDMEQGAAARDLQRLHALRCRGNREGRHWYGLRLGFFTDAVSAKQVAHYVRSEFATVIGGAGEPNANATAPQPQREADDRALAEPAATGRTEHHRRGRRPTLATRQQPPALSSGATPPRHVAHAALRRTARGAGHGCARNAREARPAAQAQPASLRASERQAARTCTHSLEETLEILGAGELADRQALAAAHDS